MNERAVIGGNNPPEPVNDPIDLALEPYADAIEEAANWLDGDPVETEDQMKAVDALIKQIRSAKGDLSKAKKAATSPLHDAWKAEIARWKPTEEDIERRLKGLAAVVDPIKRRLAAEKEATKRAAYEEARRKEREAEEAAQKARAADYEAQMEADRLQNEAIEAKKAASAANKDTVKGLRTVTKHEIESYQKALNWIVQNDRAAVTRFIDDYVSRNAKTTPIEGVNVWQDKEAY